MVTQMFDPAVETRGLAEQASRDEASYRKQIAYLLQRSPFYKRKLKEAGFSDESQIGGLDNIASLPFTEKWEIRESQKNVPPFGDNLATDPEKLQRVFSTSGTSGTPTYIALTPRDIDVWATNTARSYVASGFRPGQRLVVAFNAGPFVAGAAFFGFDKLGATVIPVGLNNTERLVSALQNLGGGNAGLSCTPSYAVHLIDWCAQHDVDTRVLGVRNISVAGEPGGSDPLIRDRVESAFGCRLREAMGTGDISTSIWGECEHADGMHFSARDNTYVELIDPESGRGIDWEDGARGELVYTSLVREAMPMLRLRSRDHVIVHARPCPCGRTSHRVRCIGRTDDMLIVRGVNLFPTAVADVLRDFMPHISGMFRIVPEAPGVAQLPPLPVTVELAQAVGEAPPELAEAIKAAIRSRLLVTTEVTFVRFGAIPRQEYKTKLVDMSNAKSR